MNSTLAGYEIPHIELKDSFSESPQGWVVVAIAVIILLGGTLLVGIAAYCVIYLGKTFSGQWHYAPGKPGFVEFRCR